MAPGESEDLARVLALPRRPIVEPGSARAAALVQLMTGRLRAAGRCVCEEQGRGRHLDTLLFPQAWALYELGLTGGLVGALAVGSGKTLVWILAPVVAGWRRAVLLVPPGLVGQLAREHAAAAGHFRVPDLVMPGAAAPPPGARPQLVVLPYSRLCRPESTAALRELDPDAVMADECHRLKNRAAAQTLRVMRHAAAADRPVAFACGSGTITSKSPEDFAHLSALALGAGSPLPLEPREVSKWAACVDASDWPAPAGALARLGEPVREALAARIRETRGVVTSAAVPVACSLVLRSWSPGRVPQPIKEAVRQVRATMCRPDGEELLTALQVHACVEQLLCGFYYRWRFPGAPDRALVDEWFDARTAWGREMRAKLERPAEHLDSERLLKNAAQRHEEGYRGPLPTWASETWARWRDVEHRVEHVTEAVWVDGYAAEAAAAWAGAERGVVWCAHTAFGREVARLAGLPWHGGGPNAEERIMAERGDRSAVVSTASHGTGRDGLQLRFDAQLITSPPADGLAWEQLLGRLHRQGQRSDEVTADVARHCAEFRDAVDRAVRRARYMQTMTDSQKLLRADVEWDLN